jgi:hypothetical protein
MAHKKTVAQAVTAFGDAFQRRYLYDSAWLQRLNSGDESAVEEVVREACANSGITVDEYEKAVLSDPELEAYQQQLIGDAILADIQPGPENPIARESAGARRETRVPRKWWQVWKTW